VPQIEVTFDIDANGILNVSAKDRATSKEQNVTVTHSSGLTEDEIKRMVTDAESHADEDKTRRETIEARNQLDTFVYSTEKALGENKDKVPEEDVSRIEAALATAKELLAKEDATKEELESTMKELAETSQRLGEVLYQQAQQAQQAAGGAEPGSDAGGGNGEGGEEVIEAEVVDDDQPEN
jgi:molecular chaperone DnaK